jgi:DNA-binding transcriptional ArsR family regulator
VALLPHDAPRRAATQAEARALAHPDRLRIIRLTFDTALTNTELAARLDRDPGTTYHHVRTLVDTGFIAPAPERRGTRGAREVPYLSTGKSWTLDVAESGLDTTAATVDALRAELLEAPVKGRHVSRLALRLDADQQRELERRITEVINLAASWEPVPDGEPWALFVAFHERPSP